MTEPIQGNSVDNVLLEWMLMLVLQKAGRLHRIVPIVLGEAWSDDRATPSMASFEDFKKWIDANVPDSRSETTYQRLLEILPHLSLSSDTASSLN